MRSTHQGFSTGKSLPQTASGKFKRRIPSFELLEPRKMFSVAGYESIDGTGNNVVHVNWGSAGTDLLRLSPAAYTDGVSSPSLASDLSARTISNLVNNQADPANPSADLDTFDTNNLSDFGYAFGQFIDHDMDLTPDGGDSFSIQVEATDSIGPNALPFTRSQYDSSTGTSTSNPRQQVTQITAYFDLSQVYGSDQATALALRTMSGGLMKTSAGGMLPYDNTTYFTADQLASLNAYLGGMADESGIPTSSLFATGDIRGNENLELTALETLFVRNHNMLAGKLSAEHPSWTDEHVYQEARKINIAGYQALAYNEYLPALLGTTAIAKYNGYKSNVNPGISNEFSTVAFRMGHSMVSPDIARDGNDGQAVADEVPLKYDFFDPNLLNPAGVIDPYTGLISTDIGPVLKSEADGNGEAMDALAVSDIRNFLFGNSGDGGDDLIARDIQRGRDNGITNYNAMRVAMALPAITSFSQITRNVTVQNELKSAYPGGVNTIDAFEGGICEDHVRGSDVGPLFQAILVNQFTRLRDGDRFFYLNEQLNPDEMHLFTQVNSLTKVIEANTDVTNLQPNAFIYTASISGSVIPSPNRPPPPPLLPGVAGATPLAAPARPAPVNVAGLVVTLLDSSGDVVATTKTNAQGQYSFNNSIGLGTGSYEVTINLPNGTVWTTPKPVTITRAQDVTGVNCYLQQPPLSPVAPPVRRRL